MPKRIKLIAKRTNNALMSTARKAKTSAVLADQFALNQTMLGRKGGAHADSRKAQKLASIKLVEAFKE